jgi:dienelactone hydrolase
MIGPFGLSQFRRNCIGFMAVLAAGGSALAGKPAVAQEPLLWGGLKPGPHAVGYRVLYELDHTRRYDPEYVADPNQPPAHRPRPILICLWYPAQKTSAQPMAYRQYLDVSSDDAQLAPFVQRLTHNIREVVCEETVGKVPRKLTPVEAAAFERFLATKTFAVKDAPAADGRFPVVIYHPGLGGTPEDNSVLFEYLASHGYVVLSSAYQDADAGSVSCGGDLTCSFRDMECLARYARGLPYADADRLAAMGHSYGAYAVLAWAAEPCSALRAFIPLDSGLEYDTLESSGVDRLISHMKANKENIRAATLRFASRERHAHFEHLDPYLKYVPRYEATVASLTHNDYLIHGAVRPALLPEKWPDAKKARRTSYDRLCQHTLYFLDATLKQRAEARESLQRSVRGEGLDEGFKLQFKPPDPVRPTPRQLSQFVRRLGTEKGAEMMRSFPDGAGNAVGAGFVLLRDGDVKIALPHLQLAAKSYPKRAGIQAMLGQALTITGDRAAALTAFRKAVELLPGDASVGGLRAYWKYVIDNGLEELGHPEK